MRDLREFLTAVERAGELRRVKAPVDARLEITEICQRVVREEGPALLFENVEGADFPLAINLFGSRRRVELALGRPPAAIGESLVGLAEKMKSPSLGTLLGSAGELARLRGMKPKLVGGGPVREVDEAPNLERLPVLTCWPDDGGPFFTFPLVHTKSPRDGSLNVGIYRMQRFGPAETGMHWQIGKGGGYHHFEAEDEGKPLPVAVALGGDPALMLAAMMPLPEGLSEAAFVGLLRGAPLELSRGRTVDVPVPARAEFVLEGEVAAGERRTEGPFGDHFGHYSAAAPFPVFRVKRVSRRRDAIYPAIVVGKPPQEDGFMGNAVQELLGPLIRLPHPEIRDLWTYEATGFHHLLVASSEERFEKEAMRSAFGLLGQGQLGLTKVLVMVGRDVDPRNLDAVLDAIADRFEPTEDFHLLTKVPFDTLDFTSYTLNVGSKMVLDCTRGPAGAPLPELPDLTTVDSRIRGQKLLGRAILAITVEGDDPRSALAAAVRALPGAGGDGPAPLPKIVAAVSPDIPLEDRELLLWGIFTRFDPARDAFFERSELYGAWPVHRGRLAIDATFKAGYPAPLEMDPEVVAKVDRRWKEYGIS
ncbi:MAG: UbiD family decarboxylase [Gemmatimonadetes bacterium]|nr:UbiD family decarboxylase [Gemmatimonadota bacterium]